MEACSLALKRLQTDIQNRHSTELKNFQSHYKKQYKENIDKWKRELSQDSTVSKKQKEAALQYVYFAFSYWFFFFFSALLHVRLFADCLIEL